MSEFQRRENNLPSSGGRAPAQQSRMAFSQHERAPCGGAVQAVKKTGATTFVFSFRSKLLIRGDEFCNERMNCKRNLRSYNFSQGRPRSQAVRDHRVRQSVFVEASRADSGSKKSVVRSAVSDQQTARYTDGPTKKLQRGRAWVQRGATTKRKRHLPPEGSTAHQAARPAWSAKATKCTNRLARMCREAWAECRQIAEPSKGAGRLKLRATPRYPRSSHAVLPYVPALALAADLAFGLGAAFTLGVDFGEAFARAPRSPLPSGDLRRGG